MSGKKSSRLLVIDASVAHAAGPENGAHPTSRNCREFLKAVLRICHKMALTPEVADEWRRHQSSFARSWRVSMEARKKVVRPEVGSVKPLGRDVERVAESVLPGDPTGIVAAVKDCHLFEAALATPDKMIVSLDEKARRRYGKISPALAALGDVVWVNPDRVDSEGPLEWLENGAPREQKRRLRRNRKSTDHSTD